MVVEEMLYRLCRWVGGGGSDVMVVGKELLFLPREKEGEG